MITECIEGGRKNQMYLVFDLIASMEEEEADKNGSKTEKRNRNEENRRQIVDFIADNGISDAKTVSKSPTSPIPFYLFCKRSSLPAFC